MRHILSANQFTKSEVDELFWWASRFQEGQLSQSCDQKLLATLFFEPSTRTRLSFESAALRLGSKVISVENAVTSTSDRKGESLGDMVRTVSQMADAIVLRHPTRGAMQEAVASSEVPIINGGDGDGEHPTQALLDLYTIYRTFEAREHGSLADKKVVIWGDIEHARTIRSLVILLTLFGVEHTIFNLTDEPDLAGADVLYMTRIQEERREQKLSDVRSLTGDMLSRLKSNAMILHPLPRRGELPTSIDQDDRAAYFKQVKNGVFLRMAVLHLIWSKIDPA